MIIVLRGLPGSGKSTWAKKWVNEGKGRVLVSRDAIRAMLTGVSDKQILDSDGEKMVSSLEELAVTNAVKTGYGVVVDAMHLRNKYTVKWFKLGKTLGVPVTAVDFNTDVEECILRDAGRGDGGVGEYRIRFLSEKFLKKGILPPIVHTVEEKNSSATYIPSGVLPFAILVDIDGTVALNTNGRGWFEWARVGEDTPNEDVCFIVQSLLYARHSAGFEIVFVSGRSDACKRETREWLEQTFDFDDQDFELFMRKEGDYRRDSIVKNEIFWDQIAPSWDVVACIDDRQQVVDEYRAMGLTVLQVAEGDF